MIQRIYYNSETREFSKYDPESLSRVLSMMPESFISLRKLSLDPNIAYDKFNYDPDDWGPTYTFMIGSIINPELVLDLINSNYRSRSLLLDSPYDIEKSKVKIIDCHPQDDYQIWFDFKTKKVYETDSRYKPTVEIKDPVKGLLSYYSKCLTDYTDESMDNCRDWLKAIINKLRKL